MWGFEAPHRLMPFFTISSKSTKFWAGFEQRRGDKSFILFYYTYKFISFSLLLSKIQNLHNQSI